MEFIPLDGRLPLLVALAIAAGLVRGFAGFGTAVVFMPLGALLLPPAALVIVVCVMDALTGARGLPDAARRANPRAVAPLLCGAVVGVPLGVAALAMVDAQTFRWTVSMLVLLTAALVASGWRVRRVLPPAFAAGVGGISGLAGGFMALAGPPATLAALGGGRPASELRAGVALLLAVISGLTLVSIAAFGLMSREALLLGAVLTLPFVVGNWTGAAVFARHGGAAFRPLTYVIMTAAALTGLPLLR